DLVRRSLPVDIDEDALGPEVLDHRLRLAVVDLQTRADRLRSVVGPALNGRASEQALHADLVRDLERENDGQLAADLAQRRVESLRLPDCPRKPVEREPVAG